MFSISLTFSIPFTCRSVFNRSIRTNNHVEGWHRRLNSKACRGQLELYHILISLLKDEAMITRRGVDLLKESHVTRVQRTLRSTERLFKLWDELLAGERSPRQLLRAAGELAPKPAHS